MIKRLTKNLPLVTFAIIGLFFIVSPAMASGTFTGKLLGSVRYAPGGYNMQTEDDSVFLPLSAVFEGGAVNGTTYSCTYSGTLNNITVANCTVVTRVVKGNLKLSTPLNKILDINNSSSVLASLPLSANYEGGAVDGSYYVCEYTGGLPKPTTAECELDQASSPNTTDGGAASAEKPITRLFSISGCPSGQELICWTSKVYAWSQTALLVSAVGAFVIAGIMYMSSGGNPQVVGKSKKIIIGALSGIAVIVLGRFFLTKVIGVPWL